MYNLNHNKLIKADFSDLILISLTKCVLFERQSERLKRLYMRLALYGLISESCHLPVSNKIIIELLNNQSSKNHITYVQYTELKGHAQV